MGETAGIERDASNEAKKITVQYADSQKKYSLKFRLINNGDRTAENIKITPMLFVATGNEIISYTNVGKLRGATNPATIITSYSKSTLYTEAFYDGIGLPNDETIENFKHTIFLAINIQYSDRFTGLKYSNTEYFGWYSFTKNQYRFKKCSIEGYNIIESYMRKNNIKL